MCLLILPSPKSHSSFAFFFGACLFVLFSGRCLKNPYGFLLRQKRNKKTNIVVYLLHFFIINVSKNPPYKKQLKSVILVILLFLGLIMDEKKIVLPKCQNCGREFLPASPRQKYCQELTCRREVNYMRVKISRNKKKASPQLGGMF